MAIQRATDRRIVAELEAAALAASEELERLSGREGVSVAVRRAQLIGARGALSKVLLAFFESLKEIISSAQREAAVAAVQSGINWEKSILRAIEPNAERRAALEKALLATADRNVQAMITRELQTKRTLSRNVVVTQASQRRRLNSIVNQSLARGEGADKLARRVREFIHPDAPGGVTYAARRLARTEINNAFHAMSIRDGKDRPWVVDFTWHLSRAHARNPGDKCEVYAAQGRFPKVAVPAKPHPQCMCFITGNALPLDEVLQQAQDGRYEEWKSKYI